MKRDTHQEYTMECRIEAGRKARENAHTQEWWEERRAEFERLWTVGLSTARIGEAFGVSKNAAVGKARRWGLTARPSPILPKLARDAPVISRRFEQLARLRGASPAAEPMLDSVYTPERDRRANMRRPPEPPRISVSPYRTCQSVEDVGRYGIGIRYCGDPTRPGASYCPDHCERYFQRYAPRGGMFTLGPSPDHVRAAAE